MADEIIKSVRINDTRGNADGSKIELWRSNRKKWVIWNDYINKGESKKFAKMDAANEDSYIIRQALIEGGGFEFSDTKYKIIQDPYRDTPPSKRIYGETPYYLTDGSRIVIKWLRRKKDADGELVRQDLGNGVSKPVYEEVTSNNDDAETLNVNDKIVEIFPPESSGIKDSYKYTKSWGIQRTKDTFPWDLNTELDNPEVFGRFVSYYDNRDGYKDQSWGYIYDDKDVLSIIISYLQVSISYENRRKLKLCFPDTETCSILKFEDYVKDPEQKIETPSTPVVVSATPSNIQIPLNILDFPEDLQLRVGEDLPEFKVYIGDLPPVGTAGQDYDEYEGLDTLDLEYQEGVYQGEEEVGLSLQSLEAFDSQTSQYGSQLEQTPYIPSGKHDLDLIPGSYVNNGGQKIQLCCIDGKPINVRVADALLDMIASAKNDGITLRIQSGFRSPYDSISTTSKKGLKVSSSSQEKLYNDYLAGKGNLAAKPGQSNHGNGIGFDLNTGSRNSKSSGNLNSSVYVWLIRNSWRFGFVRSVASEEWHFDYLPDLISKKSTGKPYAKLEGTQANRFYSDLGLQNLV